MVASMQIFRAFVLMAGYARLYDVFNLLLGKFRKLEDVSRSALENLLVSVDTQEFQSVYTAGASSQTAWALTTYPPPTHAWKFDVKDRGNHPLIVHLLIDVEIMVCSGTLPFPSTVLTPVLK
jgi:hypothetical protein